MADLFTMLGWIGSIAIVGHFLVHLYQTVILKKDIHAGTPDMLIYAISFLFLLVYAIQLRNYPFVVFFSAIILWTVLGFFDYFQK